MQRNENKKKRSTQARSTVNQLIPGVAYLFKDAKGNPATATYTHFNDGDCEIRIQNPHGDYKAYVNFTHDQKNATIEVHGIKAFPERIGLGGLLMYLLSKQALAEKYQTIQTLATAPTAFSFYTALQFKPDPRIAEDQRIPINYQDEETGEFKTILSTANWVANPTAIAKKYESNPHWTLDAIPCQINEYAHHPATYHEAGPKKTMLDKLMQKMRVLSERGEKGKLAILAPIYLSFKEKNLNSYSEMNECLAFIAQSLPAIDGLYSPIEKCGTQFKQRFFGCKNNSTHQLLRELTDFIEKNALPIESLRLQIRE